MTTPRLTAQMQVDALRRWVEADGGFLMVLQKGDVTSGQILLILLEKGDNPRLFGRQMAADFTYQWAERVVQGPMAETLSRAKDRDPDLWIIEADVANGEQLIAQLPFMD